MSVSPLFLSGLLRTLHSVGGMVCRCLMVLKPHTNHRTPITAQTRLMV